MEAQFQLVLLRGYCHITDIMILRMYVGDNQKNGLTKWMKIKSRFLRTILLTMKLRITYTDKDRSVSDQDK
jgi:hypothetical protein